MSTPNPHEFYCDKDTDAEMVVIEVINNWVHCEWLATREPFKVPVDRFDSIFEKVEDE